MGSHPPNSSPSVDGAPLSHCIFNFGNLFLVHSRHRKTNDLSKSIFFESVIGVWAAEGEIKFDGNWMSAAEKVEDPRSLFVSVLKWSHV